MSAEELAERIQDGSFLPMALTLGPLQKILLDIMALIKSQNEKIDALDQKVDKKADQAAIDSLANKIDENAKEMADRAAALENDMADKVGKMKNDVDSKIQELDDKNNSESGGSVNDRLNETNDKVGENSEKIRDLEDALKNLKEQLEKELDDAKKSKSKSKKKSGGSDDDGDVRARDGSHGADGSGVDRDGADGSGRDGLGRDGDGSARDGFGDGSGRDGFGDDGEGRDGHGSDGEGSGSGKHGKKGKHGKHGSDEDFDGEARDRGVYGDDRVGKLEDRVKKLEDDMRKMKDEMGKVGNDLHNIGDELAKHGIHVPITAGGGDRGHGSNKVDDDDWAQAKGSGDERAGSGKNGSDDEFGGRDGSGHDGSGRDGSGRRGSGHDGSGHDGSGRDGHGSDGEHGNDGEDGMGTTFGATNNLGMPALGEDPSATMGRHGDENDDENHVAFSEATKIRPPGDARGANDAPPRRPTPPTSSEGSRRGRVPLPDLNSPEGREALQQLREELTGLQQTVADNDAKTQGQINDLSNQIASILRDLADRPDRNLIERLFEKFKASLANVADMINKQPQADTKNFATREDLKRLEKLLSSMNTEYEEAACARKSTCCLSCGRPYRQVTGAIQDEKTLQILGAAPISHVTNDTKPCFVYGSDHELYYSDSPRGKTFVAPSTKSSGK